MRFLAVVLLLSCSSPQDRAPSPFEPVDHKAQPLYISDAAPMDGHLNTAPQTHPKEPVGADFGEWLRWAVLIDTSHPVSTADCTDPQLELVDKATRRYRVRCARAEFEVSAQCEAEEWSRCLRSIETWTMRDKRMEAMRKLAEARDLGIGPGAPNCRGALALPQEANRPVFVVNCRDGWALLEVVCDGSEVNNDCKVFVREQERLPYGLPRK